MQNYIRTRIIIKRVESNVTQQEMANRLNISQSYYNKLENGKIEMSVKTMSHIIDILGLDIHELFVAARKHRLS